MRNRVPRMPRGIDQFLDLVEHGVDTLAKPVEFVARPAHRNTPAKLAAHHSLRRPRQLVSATCRPARDQHPAKQ